MLVGESGEIAEGCAKRVEAFGRTVAIFRHQGRFYGIDDTCPHRGGPLGKGDIEDGCVVCPLHGWAFDLQTGEMKGHGGVRLDTFEVAEQDGQLLLRNSK